MDFLRRIAADFRQFWATLGTARRVALVTVGVLLVAALAAVGYFSMHTPYVPLASSRPPEEIAAMQAALTTATIPNRVTNNGTTIEVPEERRPQAVVALAAAGVPASGGKGFELFDESSITTTPFVQGVNYQRALQAELARSIMQLEPVQSARVMIARPEPTPFVRDQRPPTAGVVLKLKPGATLSKKAAAGIVSLVARSVEGLKPENVTVVDTAGQVLSDPRAGDRDDIPAPQLEYRQQLEEYLARKAQDMLTQHLGPGRAVVRVSADVNFQKLKERRETYSPDKVAAAERSTTSKNTSASSRGPVGATVNTPRAGGMAGGAGGGAGGGSSEERTETDYLVSRVMQDVEDKSGTVNRLTVAVMVDLSAAAEGGATVNAASAESLVKQAVGFRSGRDEITLSNVKLAAPLVPEAEDDLAGLRRVQSIVGLVRNVALALAVVLVLALAGLALLRRRTPEAPPAAPEAAPPAAAGETPEDRRRAELGRLADLVRTDPDRAAEVFGLLLGAPAR